MAFREQGTFFCATFPHKDNATSAVESLVKAGKIPFLFSGPGGMGVFFCQMVNLGEFR